MTLWAWNDGEDIVVSKDSRYEWVGDEEVEVFEEGMASIEEMIVAIAYGDTDFLELLNEGAPVALGNSYAVYEFVALQDGAVFTYRLGQNELDALNENGRVKLEPLSWNELEEIRATEYMVA